MANVRKDLEDRILLKLNKWRLDGEKGRPKFLVFDDTNDALNKESFTKATHGQKNIKPD